jgi:hypothetical protein
MFATPKEPVNVGAQSMFPMKLDEIKSLWWKDVFNSSHKFWGYSKRARDAALAASYPYFSWSGRVWYTDTGRDTGLLERDVL